MHTSIIFITGVSGAGKTTIGELLSEKTSLPFFDGDDFHPAANIAKMKAGIPLTDTDRSGWLLALHDKAMEVSAEKGGIFACSALKEQYRKILESGLNQHFKWVLLTGSFDLIMERVSERKGHYMPPELLQSQFDILEKPDYGFCPDLRKNPEDIVNDIIEYYKL